MGKLLAFDYGSKRTGVAISDETGILAFPLTTVSTSDLFEWIEEFLKKETIKNFIVGLPLRADETPASIEAQIKGFVRKLRQTYPNIPVKRHDERYTSKLAFDAMLQAGVPMKKRRDKALLDKISATIILQSYIESKFDKK